MEQTSGHGDFRRPYEVPRAMGDPLRHMEKIGASDGDPIANIKPIEAPARNLLVIMKDGKVYKNTLGN